MKKKKKCKQFLKISFNRGHLEKTAQAVPKTKGGDNSKRQRPIINIKWVQI